MLRRGLCLALVVAAGAACTESSSRFHRATADERNIYDGEHLGPIVSALKEEAGEDAALLKVSLSIGQVVATVLDGDRAKDYTFDEDADLVRTFDVPGTLDPTRAFPVARVVPAGPERIMAAIKEETGNDELRVLNGSLEVAGGKLRWDVSADEFRSGKFPTGRYQATPDGSITRRPGEPTASPRPKTRAQKYADCVGGTRSPARIRGCQRLYRPEIAAFNACLRAARTQPQRERCRAAFRKAHG